MLLREVEYARPSTLEEALRLLAANGVDVAAFGDPHEPGRRFSFGGLKVERHVDSERP